jgi:hypothetical protein
VAYTKAKTMRRHCIPAVLISTYGIVPLSCGPLIWEMALAVEKTWIPFFCYIKNEHVPNLPNCLFLKILVCLFKRKIYFV